MNNCGANTVLPDLMARFVNVHGFMLGLETDFNLLAFNVLDVPAVVTSGQFPPLN
jgi:hypothetical protein